MSSGKVTEASEGITILADTFQFLGDTVTGIAGD